MSLVVRLLIYTSMVQSSFRVNAPLAVHLACTVRTRPCTKLRSTVSTLHTTAQHMIRPSPTRLSQAAIENPIPRARLQYSPPASDQPVAGSNQTDPSLIQTDPNPLHSGFCLSRVLSVHLVPLARPVNTPKETQPRQIPPAARGRCFNRSPRVFRKKREHPLCPEARFSGNSTVKDTADRILGSMLKHT